MAVRISASFYKNFKHLRIYTTMRNFFLPQGNNTGWQDDTGRNGASVPPPGYNSYAITSTAQFNPNQPFALSSNGLWFARATPGTTTLAGVSSGPGSIDIYTDTLAWQSFGNSGVKKFATITGPTDPTVINFAQKIYLSNDGTWLIAACPSGGRIGSSQYSPTSSGKFASPLLVYKRVGGQYVYHSRTAAYYDIGAVKPMISDDGTMLGFDCYGIGTLAQSTNDAEYHLQTFDGTNWVDANVWKTSQAQQAVYGYSSPGYQSASFNSDWTLMAIQCAMYWIEIWKRTGNTWTKVTALGNIVDIAKAGVRPTNPVLSADGKRVICSCFRNVYSMTNTFPVSNQYVSGYQSIVVGWQENSPGVWGDHTGANTPDYLMYATVPDTYQCAHTTLPVTGASADLETIAFTTNCYPYILLCDAFNPTTHAATIQNKQIAHLVQYGGAPTSTSTYAAGTALSADGKVMYDSQGNVYKRR